MIFSFGSIFLVDFIVLNPLFASKLAPHKKITLIIAIIKKPKFLFEALEPSQDLNPNYGFLWWLNTKNRNPYVPRDAVWALGYLDRIVLIIPSKRFVCVRIGNKAEKNFRRKFSKLFNAVLSN